MDRRGSTGPGLNRTMAEPAPALPATPPEVARPDPAAIRQAACRHIRQGAFSEGLALLSGGGMEGLDSDGPALLLAAIACVRTGAAGPETVTSALIRMGDAADVRRLLALPLRDEGRIADAIAVFDRLVEACAPGIADRITRAGLLTRIGRLDDAIADLDAAADAPPEARDGQDLTARRIDYRLRAGRVDEAAAIARQTDPAVVDDRALALMVAALVRADDSPATAALARKVDPEWLATAKPAAQLVQALVREGQFAEAVDLGERCLLRPGLDSAALRTQLAIAWLEAGALRDRFGRAITHLTAADAQEPDNLRTMSLLGQLLLRTGQTDAALPHLRRSLALAPDMAQIRALYARALKQSGHYAEAADEFAHMVANAPDGAGKWQRYAAGALAQAGRRDEAVALFDRFVASREAGLPASFAEGLDALWARADALTLPKARLDWAWGLRDPGLNLPREEWERRAKWGHLADHYLLDWLECRDDQVEEAMLHFAEELDVLETFTAAARARAPGKGVVFASAHVGAMYFGPLALELVGERSRWLASTPSVARTSYAESLISTSDQTDTQVARAFMGALKQDNVVVIVVDGAINMAAPRIVFEGQEITFSAFAARTAQRMGAPSAFVAPVWREDMRLGFVLEHLPMAEPGEDADAYAARWQEAYLGHLRAFLAGRPENLRLSGGIWRHIR